ncbi:Glycosyltransferase family 4 protein [Gammaproteobacteria bacterium]
MSDAQHMSPSPLQVLILVENLPVPFDRRVWQEALLLVQAGHGVSVICPLTPDYPEPYEYREGVHIYRHKLPKEARGVWGFLLEYAAALWGETHLAFRIYRRHGIDVIQACNPPDLLFLVAMWFKPLGVRFVFDHHDPFPELFENKFPGHPLLNRLTRWAEWLTFRAADRVITTSEALRQIAVGRGGVPADRVTLVRSGPNLDQLPACLPDPALRENYQYLVLYLGVIGSQDGVDLLLKAAHEIVRTRRDILFAIVGDGPALPGLKGLATALGLEPFVRFTGRLVGETLHRWLASADLGVCPDPYNAFNDKLSMNKVLEYMAFGLPVVLFDLAENRQLAGEAGEVVGRDDPQDLAAGILKLLADPDRRQIMGQIGRERVSRWFGWHTQAPAYLGVYADLAGTGKKA